MLLFIIITCFSLHGDRAPYEALSSDSKDYPALAALIISATVA